MIKKYFRKILLLSAIFCFLSPMVSAEVRVFGREATKCRTISLTENIDASLSGETGPGCTFNVDVRGTGEWVGTGAYFDSPPYAWGTHSFYDLKDSDNSSDRFSFTCESPPSYNAISSSLPSYVSIVGQQPLSSADNEEAPGLRYTFKVAESAPAGSSFDIDFSYSATCNLWSNDDGTIKQSVPKENGTKRCEELANETINPRGATLSYTVSVGSACSGGTPAPTTSTTVSPTTGTPTSGTPTVDPSISPGTPGGCGSLTFSPAVKNAAVGDVFDVDVLVNGCTELMTSTDARITYNKDLLEVVSVQKGEFFPGFSEVPATDVLAFSGYVDTPAASVTGSGTLAKIQFRAKQNGADTLSFHCSTLDAGTSKIIKNDIDASNMIDCSANNSLSVTIGGAAAQATSSEVAGLVGGGAMLAVFITVIALIESKRPR